MTASVPDIPGEDALIPFGTGHARQVHPLLRVDPVLAGYTQPQSILAARLRAIAGFAALVAVCIVYGGMVTVFPVSWYIYLMVPPAILFGLIIWALPETDRYPERLLERLLFAFLIGSFAWPNYLAIALPGLPWITVNRLVTFPMALLFVISLSIAPSFRSRLSDILRNSPRITMLMVGFAIIQVLTIMFSRRLGVSFNRLINAETQWIATFFVGAYVFSKEGRFRLAMIAMTIVGVTLSIVAVQELRVGHVLWAGHVPSFLAVQDESVQRIMAGGARAATGKYRIQSTFGTSLNFAEFLALCTPVIIYWAVYAKRLWLRFAALAYLPFSFWIIIGTDSRLGAVGFFASLILYLAFWGARRWVRKHDDLVGPWVVLGYPFIAVGFIMLSFVWQKLERLVWGGGPQQASNQSRQEQWHVLWPKLGRWPIGHGIGESGATLGYANAVGTMTVDSYYIVVLLEYGVIGAFLFVGFFLAGAGKAVKTSFQSDGEESNMLIALATMIVVFLISKAVLAQDDSHGFLFMMMGAIVGLSYRIRQTLPPEPPRSLEA